MKKYLIILLLLFSVLFLVSCKEKTNEVPKIINDRNTLKIAVEAFEESLNPYYYTSDREEDIIGLISLRLFPIDKNGNVLLNAGSSSGEKGTDDKTYYGAISLEKTTLEDNSVKYTFTIKEGVLSADGLTELSYSDLLFDFYYLVDPSYDGNCLFKTLPIKGLTEYVNSINECYLIADQFDRMDALDSTLLEGIKFENGLVSIIFDRELTTEELKIFDIFIAPLYHYGDTKNFNIRGGRFGFIKGQTASSKVAKGYGMYQILETTTKNMKLSMNNVYFHPEPTYIKYIDFEIIEEKAYNDNGYRISGGDPFYLIDIGEVDIAKVELTESNLDEIKRYNVNNKYRGNIITLSEIKNTNYGYICSTKRLDIKAFESNEYSDNFSFLDDISVIKK